MLLGVRTQLKEDIHCTAAELVYGTTLRLPGEFFDESKATTVPDPTCYVTRLKTVMRDLQAPPVRKQTPANTHVSPTLKSCTHVFVRHDAVRKPLQRPYDGPYKVQKHTEKHYTIDMNGKSEVISIDRLKPAFLDIPPAEQCAPPPSAKQHSASPLPSAPVTVTRYGRKVHWPRRLSSIILH